MGKEQSDRIRHQTLLRFMYIFTYLFGDCYVWLCPKIGHQNLEHPEIYPLVDHHVPQNHCGCFLWFPISRSKPSLVISYCWLNITIIYLILYHIELSPILMGWILTPYVCCLEPLYGDVSKPPLLFTSKKMFYNVPLKMLIHSQYFQSMDVTLVDLFRNNSGFVILHFQRNP